MWATKYVRLYLFGRKFKIMTDHRPLQGIMNIKEPNSRLTRWRLRLSEYDYTVIYKPGKINSNADALSRIEIHNEESSSIVVNTSDKSDSERTKSIDSRTDSIHSDVESPILEVPISDDPLNRFSRQIVFNVVGDIKSKPHITHPFESYTKTCIQISKSNLEQDVIDAIKEYVTPRLKTGILINPSLEMYNIIPVLQKYFKN